MNWLINTAVKLSGLGWVWDKVDGAKTYIAVTLKVLTALAGLLTTLQPMLDAHNLGALVSFCKAISSDPNWKMLTDALLVLGIGHKIDKVADATPAPAPAQP